MMGERENACPTVGAAGQAMKNGTASQTAHASTTEFTTPPAERQQFRIADFLHHGAESAIARRDLMALTGLPDRDLRRLIEAERRQGIPILSDNARGYFLPGDQAERDRGVRSLRSRAAEIMETADAIEQGGDGV
ncbi:MAG: hypothetical protein K2N78_03615 [Oscillospiraceae bacterium]|nr:hypothetical protein [Oscillospiraceae bacterium]